MNDRSSTRVSGISLAKPIIATLTDQVFALKENNIVPRIAIVTIGPEASWESYVRQKQKLAEKIGAQVTLIKFDQTTQEELQHTVEQLNLDTTVHGIIIQRPVPQNLNPASLISLISPNKDIDGFRNDSRYETPIWLAIHTILLNVFRRKQIRMKFFEWLASQRIVVIGRGETGGMPVIEGLKKLGITPSIIDSQTTNQAEMLKQADIIISAVGKNIVHSNSITQDSILVGIGIHRNQDGKLEGDYNDEEIQGRAAYFTPTPGGVGPLNVAFLFKNLIQAAQISAIKHI